MENKTGIYFKYAIGEIVLVVIGILIALQINNWNEQKKSRNNIERIFSLFEAELETNIKQASGFLEYGYRKDSIANLYRKNLISEKQLKENPRMGLGLFGTRTIDFDHESLDELISLEKEFPEAFSELATELKLLKKRIVSQIYWEEKSLQLANDRVKELVDTKEWMALNTPENLQEMAQFILTDVIIKNKIDNYIRIELNENVWDASLIRNSSIALLWNLKTKKDTTQKDVRQFLKGLTLEPFIEYDCENKNHQLSDVNFRRTFTIYNNTKDIITFNYLDKNQKTVFGDKIAPKKFSIRENRLNKDQIIQVLKNGNCYKIYDQFRQDYIIIDEL